MNILFGAVGALAIASAAAMMRERHLQLLYGALSVIVLAWLGFTMQRSSGHELVPLLLLGITLSGVVRGAASKVLMLPIALLLPLTMVTERGAQLAVHDPWRAAGLVCMGAGIGFALRYAWGLSQRNVSLVSRTGALSLWAIAVPGTVLALATPIYGTRAWNVLLPMVSLTGENARVVALHESSSRAWPWLEPLTFALPIAGAAVVLVIVAMWFLRPTERRLHPVAFGLAIVVIFAFGGVLMVTPGAWTPLIDVDAQMVVDAIRPPFVPHDATTYLSPEENTWQIASAALALWLGIGGWIGASSLLIGSPQRVEDEGTEEHAAFAPLFLLAGALFFAESWSHQAVEVAAQRGAQGVMFALAALAAAAVLLRGRLRIVLCAMVGASAAIWLAATLAQKVLA